MKLPKEDKNNTIKRYQARFEEYGYSPKALGWDKGKQDTRFDVLTSNFDLCNKSILDIGCGFGDLNKCLEARCKKNYTYLGIDIVPTLLAEAKKRYQHDNVDFICGDFLAEAIEKPIDYALGSGIFNHKLEGIDNYTLIEETIRKSFNLCNEGVAFDFLSNKVDYRLERTFHSNPSKILEIAYNHTRNVILRNDYMPFEFSIFMFKDDSFDKKDTLFNRFKHARN